MELNAKTVKKALECCFINEDCTGCHFWEKDNRRDDCLQQAVKDALALITSQEQRIGEQDIVISELRKKLEKASHDADRYAVKIKELTEEAESLKQAMEHEHASFMETFGEWDDKCQRLTEENEMLIEDNEIKSQKRANIFEIANAYERGKADTVREIQVRLAQSIGTYTDKSFVYVTAMFRLLDQITKEMLEGKTSHFYHREAEKNLRLLNEACGVVWHSIADELPFENGTYLVVGKSGTVCTAHFYPEHKIPSTEYAIIPGHFSNRYVRFWAKLPEPPIPDQDYQHTDNK